MSEKSQYIYTILNRILLNTKSSPELKRFLKSRCQISKANVEKSIRFGKY